MKYYKILLLLTALIALGACGKDKEADYITSQEKTIDSYWATRDDNVYEKTIVEDIYRIVLEQGDKTKAIEKGDIVSFYYKGAILSGKGLELANIFDTNIADIAKQLGLSSASELEICENVVGKGYFISGLEKGLLQMHKGETAEIIFTSSYGYGDKAMNIIPKYSPIIFEVKIEDVKKP